jgi:hypothetical protein
MLPLAAAGTSPSTLLSRRSIHSRTSAAASTCLLHRQYVPHLLRVGIAVATDSGKEISPICGANKGGEFAFQLPSTTLLCLAQHVVHPGDDDLPHD